MATNAKAVNYTAEQEATIFQAAQENGGKINGVIAEKLAGIMAKTTRSLVAKASRMGVYEAKTYVTKQGEKPQAKNDLADAIGAVLQLTEADCESLAKANKQVLQKIFNALANSKPI